MGPAVFLLIYNDPGSVMQGIQDASVGAGSLTQSQIFAQNHGRKADLPLTIGRNNLCLSSYNASKNNHHYQGQNC